MSMQDTVKLESGHTWAVGSHVFGDACIIIPANELDRLSNEQIGEAVRSLVSYAKNLAAMENMHNIQRNGERWLRWQALYYLKYLLDSLSYSLDESPEIQEVREMLKRAIFYKEQEGKMGQPHAEKMRQALAAKYDTTFVKLGERDDFSCACCGVTDGLEIDHIVPVSSGGTNELDNLQLLCKSCNSSKGMQTIDYRNEG